MRRLATILFFLVYVHTLLAQGVEVARFELSLASTSQQCCFIPLDGQGLIVVAEDNMATKGTRNWEFAVLDTNLVVQNTIAVPLDATMRLHSTTASEDFGVAVLTSTKRFEPTKAIVVLYNRKSGIFSNFVTALPSNITLLPATATAHALMLAYNHNTGGSAMSFYNLESGLVAHETPHDGSLLVHSIEALPSTQQFVATMKKFEEKRSAATCFMVFDSDGSLANNYCYPNSDNATIGKTCCTVGKDGSLNVFATIERTGNTKISVKDFANNYDRESVGVCWLNFSPSNTQTKFYLFKNIPGIDKALTPGNRLKVKQRQVQKTDSTGIKGEIAFRLLKPSLLTHNDTSIMALEAFTPYYHTETRTGFGYYGSVPTTYTVFDGYDFYAHLLFAFNGNGELLWHNHTCFDNPLDENLTRHISEAVCLNEIVTLTMQGNTLEYNITDLNGNRLLDNGKAPLPLMRKNDILDTEYGCNVRRWYDNNFLAHGRQTVKNRMTRKASRYVFFLQKIQYE